MRSLPPHRPIHALSLSSPKPCFPFSLLPPPPSLQQAQARVSSHQTTDLPHHTHARRRQARLPDQACVAGVRPAARLPARPAAPPVRRAARPHAAAGPAGRAGAAAAGARARLAAPASSHQPRARAGQLRPPVLVACARCSLPYCPCCPCICCHCPAVLMLIIRPLLGQRAHCGPTAGPLFCALSHPGAGPRRCM
jgi:hypothetical protein